MADYVEIPRERFISFFKLKGFTEAVAGHEVVLDYYSKDLSWKVRIYTTIPANHTISKARERGADSIKVVLLRRLRDGRVVGAAKFPRVFRVTSVESVIERTLDRAREAFAIIIETQRRESHL